MRRSVSLLSTIAVLGFSTQALADCPPGAWFCADVTVPGQTPPPPDDKAPPAKDRPTEKKAVAPSETTTSTTSTTTTVVPGSSGATTVIVNTAPPVAEAKQAPPPPPPRVHAPPPPPTYEPPAPPPPRVKRSEWGLNLRLEGALMGDHKADKAGMGGAGLSLRARPTPHFALDVGVDFLGGKDWQGYQRSEVPFTVNALLFVNPKSKTQVYFLGGIGWSSAQVQVDPTHTDKYGYFGVQGGVGLEFRVSRAVALDLDVLGFVRGRTDSAATNKPEFTDPSTGRTTNTSGGGLFRGGLTIYW